MKRLLLFSLVAALGCGDDDGTPNPDMGMNDASVDMRTDEGLADAGVDAAEDAPDAPTIECELDAPRGCVDEDTREICVAEGDDRLLQSESCADPASCLFGTCATPAQLDAADQLRRYMALSRNQSASPYEHDWPALEEDSIRLMLADENLRDGIVRGATRFAISFGHGHQGFGFRDLDDSSLCGDTTNYAFTAQTFYAGVCGKPYQDGVLVMSAPEGNALGLVPGDVVVATSEWEAGPGFLRAVLEAPGCFTRVGASEESYRAEAAATLFGKIDEGMTLTVRNLDGEERIVNVPAREAEIPSGQDFCTDPFGGFETVEGRLDLRDDGVAVIRVSTLRPQGPWPDRETYDREVQNFLDRVGVVLADVPDGAPIIWDIRGNNGGGAEVALGFVAGMAGAETQLVSQAFQRINDTDPPEWSDEPVDSFSYTMTVSDDSVMNHQDHPTAVLIDGQTLSAADFFAYAAKEFTDALIVGDSGTSGIYGFGGLPLETIEGETVLIRARVDPLISRTPDGMPLERRSVQPDMLVSYEPADVAMGRDTVLEAAAAALLAE